MNPEEQVDVTKVVIHSSDASSGDSVAIIALIVTIALAVIGWGISVYLQQRNIKLQMRAQIGYDIYSQLVTAHKELQDAIAAFNASTSAPLILMQSEMVPYEVQQQLGRPPTVSEDECLHKGRVKYSKWLYDDMFAKNSEYIKKLSTFMYLTEDWASPLASLTKAIQVLRSELSRLNGVMTVHKEALQHYSMNNGDDWRQWDENDVYGHGRAISDAAMLVSSYIGDFMVLAHNELLAPYYGHERLVRKTLDDSFQVLTKEGLVTRIEDDPEIRAWAEEMLNRNTPTEDEDNR